mgnify:CR=1 FL=1
MSNSVSILNGRTRQKNSADLTFQVTALKMNQDTGQIDASKWTFSDQVEETSKQGAKFSDVQNETSEEAARQVLQHFPHINAKLIADMVLIRMAGRTDTVKSAVMFAMVRLIGKDVWMVSSTTNGKLILEQQSHLYEDIRKEMISGGIASKDDQFKQAR